MFPSDVGPCFAQLELNSPLLQLADAVQAHTRDIQDVAAIYSAPDSQTKNLGTQIREGVTSQANCTAGELWEAGHSWPTELLEPVAKGKGSARG